MKKTAPLRFLLPLAFILSGANVALASDSPLFHARLEPCGGRWVAVGSPLRLTLTGLRPDQMAHLDLATLRLLVDGVDLTGPFPALAAAAGKVAWDPGRAVLALEVPALLPPGPHRWELTCRPRRGLGRLRWGGPFHLYTPARALPLARREAEGLAGASIKVEDFDPPDIETTPGENAFLHDSRSPLEVRWSDTLTWVDLRSVKILLDRQDITATFTLRNWGASRDARAAPPIPDGRHTFTVQAKDALGNLAVSSVRFVLADDTLRAPWPFQPTNTPGTVGHTHHQYQKYGGQAYFHHGVDIMPAAQSPIQACRGGKVETLYWYGSKPYYFEVGIRDAAGFLWQYHHVDEPTVPQTVKDAYTNKTALGQGAFIGNIVWWPASSYGKNFHHTHVNVLDPDGRYVNPLHFLLKQKEKVKPSIYEILVAQDNSSIALNTPSGPRPVISGGIDIIARADDKDGLDVYELTTYRMDWGVIELTGTKSHNLTLRPLWVFDSLPGGGDRYKHVGDVFQLRITYGGNTYYTKGDYNSRSFYYNVTNRLWGLPNPAGCWQTDMKDIWNQPLFPNGVYRIIVRAMDESGNLTTKTLDVEVKN